MQPQFSLGVFLHAKRSALGRATLRLNLAVLGLLTLVPVARSACVPAPSGLVSWWAAEGSGADLVGGNDGVVSGDVTFASGRVGQAFSFGGVTGSVVVPAATNLAFESLTIEGWILPLDISGRARPIVEYGNATGPCAMNLWYNIGPNLTGLPGSLNTFFRDPSGAAVGVISAAGLLVSNQWSHVAVTFDAVTMAVRLYHNGVNVGVATSTVPVHPQSFKNVNFGYRPAGSSDIFRGRRHLGKLDEMSIYNRALSDGELQAIYAAGSAGKCSPNQFPVAVCADAVVGAGTNCQAAASINNGSFDPDGDPITVSQVPPGPYPLGTNHVMLVVSDSHGASNVCSALVIVQDRTPPVIVCASNKVMECGAAWSFDPPVAFDDCSLSNLWVSIVSTVTNAGCGGSLTATRTWQAVDGFTNTATCSQTVTVLDTTPPTIVCPASLTVEFQDETGAVVPFVVTASDVCSPVGVVVTPSSGSRFPIGVTPVQATAVDGCTNASQCGFSVTVLGAQGVKSNVLAELITLRVGTTLDESFAVKFDYAIEHLRASLSPAYWVDQTHLQAKSGNAAMNEEKLAANKLAEIMEAKECPVEVAVLQGFVDRIVKCDRLLAVISIQEAAEAGLNARKVAQDYALVVKGDREAEAGHYANAIEHYRNAWRHALKLELQVRVNADGSTRLHFVDNGSKSYVIEVSADLVNWVSLGTCTADGDGNVTFTDANAVNQAARFYRVVEP